MRGVKATGHNSLLHDRDGSVYLVNHARPEGPGGRPFIQIRRLLIADDGRVLVWPLTYDGQPMESVAVLPERWQMVYHSRLNNGVTYSRSATAEQGQMAWDGDRLRMTLFFKDWDGFVYRQGEKTACTLISPDGEALWGIAEE